MTSCSRGVALFDLDGSLADYDSGMERRLRAMRSPGEPIGPGEWLDARKWSIRQDPNFWLSLERLEGGWAVLQCLEAMGYEIHILTKGPQSSPGAWTAKMQWVRERLGDYPVTMAANKSMVYGRVLYDDWPAYVTPWLQARPRGRVLMPTRAYNDGYRHQRCLMVDDSKPDIVAIQRYLECPV